MAGAITGRVANVDIVLEAIRQMGGPKTRAALRRGVTKAARIMVKAAKAKAPHETGALKKSLTFKVYTTKSGGVGAVIGPDKDYKAPVIVTKRGSVRRMTKRQTASGMKADAYRAPFKYAHMVEYGRAAVTAKNARMLVDPATGKAFGKAVAPWAGKPFMRPAFEENKQQAQDLVAAELAAALEKHGNS